MKTRYVVENALWYSVKKLQEESKTQARDLREIDLRLKKVNKDVEELKKWASTLPKI